MKSFIFSGLTALICTLSTISCDSNKDQSEVPDEDLTADDKLISAKVSRDLAEENDSVWVIITHVRPNKREVFEKFVRDIFFDPARKLNADEQTLVPANENTPSYQGRGRRYLQLLFYYGSVHSGWGL